MTKIAYIYEPQVGGAFTFFTRLRAGLKDRGFDCRCVPSVPAREFAGSRFAESEGVDYLDLPEGLPEATAALIRHFTEKDYALVVTLPCCGVLNANLARYLPAGLRCAVRVPMMTRGAYAPTKAVAGHVDRIVAVSDRVASDLVDSYGIERERVTTIFNGVDPSEFPARAARQGPFRVFYSGRLTDLDKGVLLLPDILKTAREEAGDIRLLVAGNGPDRQALEEGFRRLGLENHVEMLGSVRIGDVSRLMAECDCLVLPSRFEGCPNAMLEAMAAGCVPVASNIRGSIAAIVEDGAQGFLAPVGDTRAFGHAIARLAKDSAMWRRMSDAARGRILERFTVARMADQYAALFKDVLEKPSRRNEPLPLSSYNVPREMQPTWRTRIPLPLKNLIRTWMERFGRST